MVPNIFHFVFGMTEDFGNKPFSLVHYLSIKSAVMVNRPHQAILWYKYTPSGYWWEKSKTYVDIQRIDDIFSNKLESYAHRADIVRLEKLIQYGGVYIDLDVICIDPFKPLKNYNCVWGIEETENCLCNGVILAQPNSKFLGLCLEGWKDFEPWMWNEVSCYYPARIAREKPRLVHIVDRFAFHWPLWRPIDGINMFKKKTNRWPKAYCRHLWESKFWDQYLKDLSVSTLLSSSTNFANLVKPYIFDEKDE